MGSGRRPGHRLRRAPVALLRSPVQDQVPHATWLIGMVVGAGALAAAIVVVAAGHTSAFTERQLLKFTAAGAGEEILWRGAIWSSLTQVGLSMPMVVTVDVALFVSWHVPSVLAGDSTWTGLPNVAALGLVFCIARIASRRVELPALLHVAADLLGT